MIPEIVLIIGQTIYYVVEIIQLIMESDIWGDFVEWFKHRTN